MEDEMTIDLAEIWAAIKKNSLFIKKVTAGCVVAAGVYLVVVSPTYESTALLRVKQPKSLGSSLLDSMPMGNAMATKQLMSTYAEILKSRSVVVPVIEKTEEPDDEGKYPGYEGYVKKRIQTTPFKDTEIMQVTVTAKTPEGAQQANQLLVDGFLTRLTELERGEQKATRIFIEERVRSAKQELAAAEQELANYKKDKKIIAPDAQVKLAADKMSMADKLRAENQVALETARARNNSVTAQLRGNAVSIADNTIINGLQTKLAQLENDRISYLDKYTDKHPLVIEVNKEIAGIRAQMEQEIAKVAAMEAPSDNTVYQGLLADKFRSEAEMAVAQSNLDAIEALEEAYKADVENLSETEREYLTLFRDANVSQEIYVMLAKRLEEAKVAEVAVSTEVQVVDSSTLPEVPVKPRKAMTMLLGLLLGLFGSCGFVVARELLNKTIKTSEDVQQYLGLPVLGQVPDVDVLKKLKEEENLTTWGKVRKALWK